MDGASGQVRTDTRVRTVDHRALRGDVRLPGLDGVEPVDDPFLDTVGRIVGGNRLLVLGAGAAGLLAGAALPGGSALRRLATGTVGAGLGLVAGVAVACAADLVGGRGAPDSRSFVRDVPGAGSTARRGEPGERLRVLDWNVRELIGPDGIARTGNDALDAIEQVVERERPDVLVLQEVAQDSVLSRGSDNLQELADRLGATDAVLVPNGLRASGKAKGQAVLTFGDARVQDARGLRHADPHGDGSWRRIRGVLTPLEQIGIDVPDSAQPTYHPRTTADVLVTTAGGTDVRVLDVHLSGTGIHTGGTPGSTEAQERQLRPVVDTLDAWQGPTLLLGDFNVNAHGAQYAYERELLGGAGMREAFAATGGDPASETARTFPAGSARRNIDRAWSSSELSPREVRVLSDAAARAGSDHLPVLVDYELS